MDNDLVAIIKLMTERVYVTVTDAEEELSASRRQVTYRISKINALLNDHKLPPVTYGSEREFLLARQSKQFLMSLIHEQHENEGYIFSKKERRDYIYLMLFVNHEYIKLNHFMDALQISRSTALADIKDLMFELEGNDITIKNNRDRGYYLTGSEMDIRRYMMRLVIMSINQDRHAKVFDTFIDDTRLDPSMYSSLIIKELSEKYNITFVEDRLLEFIYIFIYLRARIISGKDMSAAIETLPGMDLMHSFKEYQFTKEMFTHYKNNNLIPDQEIYYISSWILGISVGNVEEDYADCLIIGEIVAKIMNRFEYISGVRYNDTEEIFRQLFSHFRPAYYRLLFKLPIYNPLCERVKEEYSELFALVKETMKPFNDLFGDEIPDDELAYLTIHFATIYSRNRVGERLEKKRALIVCSNGIGSSAILYNDLKNTFQEFHFYPPIEVSGVPNFTDPVDIIFTTQFQRDFVDKHVPVIKVSPIMDVRERYDMIREVYMRLNVSVINQPNADKVMSIIRKYATILDEETLRSELLVYINTYRYQDNEVDSTKGYLLSDIVSEDIITLNLEANDWEAAIDASGKVLVEGQRVTQHYVDEIIRVARLTSPYFVIAPHVALPHTMPEKGALSCSMGITTLKEPVVFGNKENDPVKYIFFLSALDNESHLPAMSVFLELMNQEAFYTMLDTATSPKEIVSYIKNFEATMFDKKKL